MRYISLLLIGLITYITQVQLFPMIFTKGYNPDLFLLWVIGVTLIKGRKKGLIVALIAGAIQDIVIGNFFGLHILPYLMVAYIGGRYTVDEEQWYRTMFFTMLLVAIVDSLATMGLLYFGFPEINFFMYYMTYFFPVIFIDGALSIIIHKILWKLMEKQEYVW